MEILDTVNDIDLPRNALIYFGAQTANGSWHDMFGMKCMYRE